MKQLRALGYVLLVYGGVMTLLLVTPWKHWAADHSIVALVSRADRRIDNEVHGSVDLYMSLAGDVAVLFAGLWFAFYVPRMLRKYGVSMATDPAAQAAAVVAATPPPPPPPGSPLPPPRV